MKNFYLVAAIAGAVIPYIFFIDFFTTSGLDIVAFVSAIFVNSAAGGFTADLLITSFVFWIFMISNKTEHVWLYILLNLSIGLSCALPAYLYARERNTERHRETEQK